MYAVILAGGGGTRLWPVSRPERPKPFLPLLGSESLLQRTVARLRPILGPEDVFVVTDQRYAAIVHDQLPGIRVVGEPAGRNTAAAVALAATHIERPEDEVMIVLPADHSIADEERYRAILGAAAGHLATGAFGIDDPLVTLGVRPDGPSTEYGYLRPDPAQRAVVAGLEASLLTGFEEKPSAARARELLQMPGVAWNAGMFLWRRRAIRSALERHTSLLTLLEPAVGSELALRMVYDRLNPTSIDRAVMEGAAQDRRVVMGALDVGWSDLGGWTALLGELGAPGVEARIVQTGETVETTDDDLVLTADGASRGSRAVAAPAGIGPTTAREPFTLLRSARPHESVVAALLDRCATEARV